MDEFLTDRLKERLNHLMDQANAQVLTCYFFNRHSELYWLFHTHGDIHYKGQMHGPLTHPDQNERMDSVEEGTDGVVAAVGGLPLAFSKDILNGESFVTREGIKGCARIRIRHAPAQSEKVGKTAAVIFLNYRVPPTTMATHFPAIREFTTEMEWVVRHLCDQPRLDDGQAWRLRSWFLRLERGLGDILGPNAEYRCRNLYDMISKEAYDIVSPKRGNNTCCTLFWVDATNQTAIISQFPPIPDDIVPLAGEVVEYVARTGQLYLIQDTAAYTTPYSSSSSKNRPLYSQNIAATKCQLACPVIVQKKVVAVINLEADTPNAYGEDHVLMLFHLAAAAAMAVRQAKLWQNINAAIEVGVSSEERTPETIFKTTVQIVEKLGYQVAIYDYEPKQERWYPSNIQDQPRPDGFTARVKTARRPIALADLCVVGNDLRYRVYVGNLDEKSQLFLKWDDADSKAYPEPSPEVMHRLRQPSVQKGNGFYSDLGFPIYSSAGNGEVRAVLWVKCSKPFLSLLNEDSWCLSLLCRIACVELKLWEAEQARSKPAQEARDLVLKYHFGKHFNEVRSLINREPNALKAKGVEQLIVMCVQLRGCAKLAEGLRLKPEKFHDFLRRWRILMAEAIAEQSGVFENTMSDKAHAVFNVYRKGVIAIELGLDDDKNSCIIRSVKCAQMMMIRFHTLLTEIRSTRFAGWPCALPHELGLSIGLAIGSAEVGSLSEHVWAGADFSVFGEAVHAADKFASHASPDMMLKAIQQGTTPSLDEPKSAKETLVLPNVSILAASYAFYTACEDQPMDLPKFKFSDPEGDFGLAMFRD